MLDVNFNQIIEIIKRRKHNAYRKVNEELILLYLDIGEFLYELIENSSYGDKITTKAANFMKTNYPEVKGFTKRNIERMIQFYKTYKNDEIATPLVTQLSWTNNLLILSGSKSSEERHFYLQLSIKENYSKRELDRQISSAYYERYLLSEGNALPSTNKTIDEEDYPDTRILDLYSLEFLDLPNEYIFLLLYIFTNTSFPLIFCKRVICLRAHQTGLLLFLFHPYCCNFFFHQFSTHNHFWSSIEA